MSSVIMRKLTCDCKNPNIIPYMPMTGWKCRSCGRISEKYKSIKIDSNTREIQVADENGDIYKFVRIN